MSICKKHATENIWPCKTVVASVPALKYTELLTIISCEKGCTEQR